MSNLVPFQFQGSEIRVITDENGEPLFVGKDICEALGYANVSDAMTKHCKGVAKRYPLQTSGGIQEMRVLGEPDVLRLIVNSKLPAAQAFERLVFEEILPKIRRTGSYSVPKQRRLSVDPALSALRQAKALETAANVAGGICDRFPSLGQAAQQVIYAKLLNPVAGSDVIPLPPFESKTYSANEVGAKLGVSGNKIGRLANEHDLKGPEYGVFVLDKSRSSDKQVESFRYNERGVARLAALISGAPRVLPSTQGKLPGVGVV